MADGFETDYFISRLTTPAATAAQEVADILKDAGFSSFSQNYDIGYSDNFIIEIHKALKRCEHFIALLTKDYDEAPYTMMEWANFYRFHVETGGQRRFIVLRVEECDPPGLLAGIVYQDLAGVTDPAERRKRILAAVEGRSSTKPTTTRLFENVPTRDRNFTGRDAALAELHTLLMDDKPAAITQAAQAAIHGLGGIGKTTLAAEYAHRYQGTYAGVYWCKAESRTLLIQDLAALAARLDPKLAELADQEKAAQAGLSRLAAHAGLPYLLVYDNVETPKALKDLLPHAGARVLITTRYPDWGGLATTEKLDVLAPDAAATFLEKRAGRKDSAGAAKLADALGYLPLALDHAGAYCRLTGESFTTYGGKIAARIDHLPDSATYEKSVAATFELAIEKAAAKTQAAETLLGFCAFLAPERIPLDLVDDTILTEDERSMALAALASVSLVEHTQLDDGAPAVTLHRLVQAAMRIRLANEEKADFVVERLTRRLTLAFPRKASIELSTWPRCAVLLPHVLALRELDMWGHDMMEITGELLARTGSHLRERGLYAEAEPLLRDALRLSEVALGSEHDIVANRLNNLAFLLKTTGSFEEAEPLYRKAITIGENALGHEHPNVAIRLNNLAGLLRDAGRFAEAEPLFREALAISEKALGREHPSIATRLNNLGLSLSKNGRFAEAEPLYREALAISEKALGRDHPSIAIRLNNLGLLLYKNDRFAEAEPLLREALMIDIKLYGDDHPNTALCHGNLSALLIKTNRATEALPHAQAALVIFERALGHKHRHTMRSASSCAKALAALGRDAEAAELRQRYIVKGDRIGSSKM
jgi:tetratricopeptide (TPR) repeat protein